MRKIILIFTFFWLWSFSPNAIHSQVAFPYVDNLCYTETYMEDIRVSTHLDVYTLTFQDKLRFQKKSYVKEHHEYFAGNNPVHDIRYRHWENIFPQWYQVADLIRMDETGVRSFFLRDNPYLPGGWAGHTYTITDAGYYGIDPRNNRERYHHQYHSPISLQSYNDHRESVQRYGYLSRFTFFYPTVQTLAELAQNGFTVTQEGDFVNVSNQDIDMTWRNSDKTMITKYFEDGILLNTKITRYKYFENTGQYLKYLEKDITPDVLENGDCIEIVSITRYDDFSINCQNSVIDIREDRNAVEGAISIIPNPADDNITLTFAGSKDDARLNIVSSDGRIMHSSSIESTRQIDISMYPVGIYIANIVQGQTVYTAKFVKQ